MATYYIELDKLDAYTPTALKSIKKNLNDKMRTTKQCIRAIEHEELLRSYKIYPPQNTDSFSKIIDKILA